MTGGQFSAHIQGYYNSGSITSARRAVANYDSTGAMPNSGNFTSGSNGTGPIAASNLPPLQRTPTRTARMSDQRQTSPAAIGYSGDLGSTQRRNLNLLQQRNAAIGGTDSFQDSVDVNSRLRADQVQLRQEAIDAAAVWGSLIGSTLIQDVSRQSQVATALVTAGGPARAKSGDIMPGIPSPTASAGSCGAAASSGGTCGARLMDNPLNVSAYLGNFAAASAPTAFASPVEIVEKAAALAAAILQAAQTN